MLFSDVKITRPPNNPEINGPTSGIPETIYNYSIVASDPDNDGIYYFIDWDDDSIDEWIGRYKSGETIVVSHIWEETRNYQVQVRTEDRWGAKSDVATLEMTIPKSRPYINGFLQRFLDNHPRMFPLLRQILNL